MTHYIYHIYPISEIDYGVDLMEFSQDDGYSQNIMSILSLNLFLRPPLISARGNDHKNERMREFLRSYACDYSVICLQEVFGYLTNRRNELIATLSSEGYECAWSKDPKNDLLLGGTCCMISPHIIDGGLVIAVRGHITHVYERIFKKGKHADRFSAKGVLCVQATTLHGPLQIYNLHLQAHDDPGACKVRQSQLAEIREFIEQTWDSRYPALIAGDFNIDGCIEENLQMIKKYLQINEKCFVTNVNTMNGMQPSPTFGLLPTGSVLAQSWYPNSGQMIDMFWMLVPVTNTCQCIISDFNVQNFISSVPGCFNISDHAGITADMSINRMSPLL